MSETKSSNYFVDFINEALSRKYEVKLIEVRNLNEFNALMKQALLSLYDHPDKDKYDSKTQRIITMFATVLNSSYSQYNHVFMLSCPIYDELLKKDPNVDCPNGCASKGYYYEMIAFLLSSGWLEEVRKSTGNRAGLYELKAEEFFQVLATQVGVDVLEGVKQKHITWYDDFIARDHSYKKADKNKEVEYKEINARMEKKRRKDNDS